MCDSCPCQQEEKTQPVSENQFTRRSAVGLAGAAAGSLTLSACSSSQSESLTDDTGGPSAPTDMAAAADVPVGGVIKATASGVSVMIAQPSEGQFRAFSSVCTHQGCQLNAQMEKTMTCPCHSSVFSLEDGSPTGGPAETALAQFPVEVKEGRIWVG